MMRRYGCISAQTYSHNGHVTNMNLAGKTLRIKKPLLCLRPITAFCCADCGNSQRMRTVNWTTFTNLLCYVTKNF